MRHGLSIRVDVDDHDVIFYGDSGRTTIERRKMRLQIVEILFLTKVVW